MPKQFEQEKKRLDRQKQAKELVSNLKKPEDGPSNMAQDRHESQGSSESNDHIIRKSLIATFLGVQQKLENQAGFDCSLSGSTVIGVY